MVDDGIVLCSPSHFSCPSSKPCALFKCTSLVSHILPLPCYIIYRNQ
jgi:hypothetical protein